MMMNSLYTKKVMEYFLHPKNMGEIKNADGIGKVGNIVCGDVMWLYIKVKEDKRTKKKKIADIKFKTFGCAAAIATSSAITELVKGKDLEEAMALEKEHIVKSLGGLPPIKIHCSVLASDALAEAIYDYMKRNNIDIPKELAKRHERIAKEAQKVNEEHEYLVRIEEAGVDEHR